MYFDEDVDARLVEALQQRDYDIETTVMTGLLEASDEQQWLKYISWSSTENNAVIRLSPKVSCINKGYLNIQ